MKSLRDIREEAERSAIASALNETRWNVARTARLLGVTRPTVYDKIKRYSIRPPKQEELQT